MDIFAGPVRAVSPLERCDPRLRLAVAAAFIVLILSVRGAPALAALTGLALTAALAARLRPLRLLARLAGLDLFMLLLILLLPLSLPGEPLLTLGPLIWSRPGLIRAGTIALRANAIMIACSALLAGMGPVRLGYALGRLYCPQRLVHLLLVMVRYVEVFHRDYHRLRDAMRLRGFRPRSDLRTLRAYGHLIGTLLARSLDHAERILEAMRCRGFTGRLVLLEHLRAGRRDLVLAGLALAVLLPVLACELIGRWAPC